LWGGIWANAKPQSATSLQGAAMATAAQLKCAFLQMVKQLAVWQWLWQQLLYVENCCCSAQLQNNNIFIRKSLAATISNAKATSKQQPETGNQC